MATHRVQSTSRLTLVPADEGRLQALLSGVGAFELVTGLKVAEGFCPFEGAIAYSHDRVRRASSSDRGWWAPRLFVLSASHEMIGLGGFKGPPVGGRVELGYSVSPLHQGRGFATEAVKCLIDQAMAFPEVRVVVAYTLAHPSASTRVLEKCGFERVAEILDPEEGMVWRWERARPGAAQGGSAPE